MPRWLPALLLVLCAARPARAGSFNLGFVFQWRQTNLGEHVSGMLFLALPLDRLGRPRIPLAAPSDPREGRLAETPAPSMSFAPPLPTAPAAAKAPTRPELVDSAFARRLVRAALRVRGALRADDRLDGLASRSRASSALPELTLRAVRSTDESLRLSPSGTYVNDYTQTGGAGLLLEARATWKLDRLVFADEELRIEQLRVEREQASERVASTVLKLLFSWQRARAALLDPELTPDQQLKLEVEQLEAEAALDLSTDGLFSAERRAREVGSAAPAQPSPPSVPGQTPAAR